MVLTTRPSRLSIEAEFYTPIPHGQGQRVEFNAGAEAGGLMVLGFILRCGACYYVAGPDCANTEQELLRAIQAGNVSSLGIREAPATRVHCFGSLLKAVEGLCRLIDLAYGPEGEQLLDEQDEEEEPFDACANPEDSSYAMC
ncbi:hypothetical protein LRS06_21750 [Hymenobacter sp. J193]|uniref:hypothetical protein n=1 Tax=Hymenobacter sp. J193 TaxID=2898429 RepID=UPI002150AB65|nr:hypothetical protein [Hymenobacter sp. J193]MCR5890355.1 hypothetical protein [Hymenobacter sp. J193]